MNIRPLTITRSFTLLCALLIALSNSKAFANEVTNGSTDALIAKAWEALRKGDAVDLMRHALAPGTGDPTNFQLDNCSTQRNLSDEGREQAKRIGDYLRTNRITNASIFSSVCYYLLSQITNVSGKANCEPVHTLLNVNTVLTRNSMTNAFEVIFANYYTREFN